MAATLFDLADELPSGFHDALVRRLTLDFERRTATLHVSICVGDPEAARAEDRDVFRDVTVLIEGLLFCHVEAPDPQYAYAAPQPINIDLCET